MRSGNHAQWAVALIAIVEVQAHGQHRFEDRDRWLDMSDAGLHRPGAKSGDLGSLLDGDGAVLVPRHFPIRARGLVEEKAADEKRLSPHDWIDEQIGRAHV